MSENSEIALSRWQLLFRNHEQAIWQSDRASLRTLKVISAKDDNADQEVLKAIAREISMWRSREFNHYREKQKRRGMANATQPTQSSVHSGSELHKQLEDLIGNATEIIVPQREISTLPSQVDPSHIELYEINENSRVIASVYPLSFRCHKCGHYEIIDPKSRPTLICPCCKVAYCPTCEKEVSFSNDNKCTACNQQVKRNELQQFSFVFACPRCANVEPLTPRIEQLRNVMGHRIPCQNGKNSNNGNNTKCNGHMHFWMHGSLLNAYWKCETCNYNEKVDKHCKCHISKVEGQLPAIPSIMKPVTTSASSIMRPLIKSYLYMGTSTVTLDGLTAEHNKAKSLDTLSWRLSEEVPTIDLQVIKEQYGITDSFTVPEITTMTIVYGYISGIQTSPVRITDDERLAQLFKHGHKYHAYVVKTKGRGLVVVLDKGKIMDVLKKSGATEFNDYKDLVNQTLTEMQTGKFQNIIENPHRVSLISLLHGIEHAFIKTLMDQTGLESYGSKLMLDDCCIILYEREDLGSGGLAQLTKSRQGSEFKKFLLTGQKHLRMCSQLCDTGCLACIFINDFYCQPYLPNEVDRWFPPNSILDRNISRTFFNIK